MTTRAAVVALLGCMMMSAVESASTHLMRRMPKRSKTQPSERQDYIVSGQSAMQLGASSKLASHAKSGQAAINWMTYRKKLVDPDCRESSDEFRQNLGKKNSVEECLEAVKASKLGNVGLWHRGSDKSCHVCSLLARGRATSLKYKDSKDIDSLVQVYSNVCPGTALNPGAAPPCHLYSNNGNTFMRTPGEWAILCHHVPEATTKYVSVTYGAKTDFFKPIYGSSFCRMLQTNIEHEFSTDGSAWQVPDYYTNGEVYTNSSDVDWPKTEFPATDSRNFLNTWFTKRTGTDDPKGGYGSQAGDASWGQAFDMHYMLGNPVCTVTDGSAVSDSYPCECGNIDCSTGDACEASVSQCAAPTVSTVNTDANANSGGGTDNTTASGGSGSNNAPSTQSGDATQSSGTGSNTPVAQSGATSNSGDLGTSASDNDTSNATGTSTNTSGTESTDTGGNSIRKETPKVVSPKIVPFQRSGCADPAARLLSTILAVLAMRLALS